MNMNNNLGGSNNDMLRLIMKSRGKIPNKIVRRHFSAYELLEKQPHWDHNYRFKQHDKDPVTSKFID